MSSTIHVFFYKKYIHEKNIQGTCFYFDELGRGVDR